MKKSGIRITTGIVLFFAIVAILCSSREMLFAEGISMIDTKLNRAGDSAFFVRTKMDFGSNEYMRTFPRQVGDWEGIHDYDWAMIKEALGADMMLVRAYIQPELYQPLFLLIAQSKNVSSFHPPPVCYRALGYDIDEEGTVNFPVTDSAWAGGHWRSKREGDIFKGELSAKKLIISRQTPEGDVSERRVVLYYYVKDSEVVTKNITMVEVSALAPISLSDDGILDLLKTLMGDTLPVMFEPRESKSEMLATQLIRGYGFVGWIFIIVALAMPVAIMFLPVKKLKGRKVKQFTRVRDQGGNG